MNWNSMCIRIDKVSTAVYGNIHTYVISISYENLQWEVHHRFSEFLELNSNLKNDMNLDGIPNPPSKSMTRPQDPAVLEERRIMLNCWIQTLCSRPDVRTSSPFLEFIEFERHTNLDVKSLGADMIAMTNGEPYNLTDFFFIESDKSIIATFEESAGMSRVGKVWSLIDSDDVSCISHYSVQSNYEMQTSVPEKISDNVKYSINKVNQILMTNRSNSLYFHSNTKRLFVGLDSGVLDVYSILYLNEMCENEDSYESRFHSWQTTFPSDECINNYSITKETSITLHNESIIYVHGSITGPGVVLTIGFDDAIRLLNCTTLETISGGKLTKRLSRKEQLTTGILEEMSDELSFKSCRIFIGTSKGKVFIFSSLINPPEYRYSILCNKDYPITALEIAKSNLLVANKYTLFIYKIGPPGEEHKTQILTQLQPTLDYGRTIRSIAISSQTPFLFLGHTFSISIWNCHTNTCVACFRAHNSGVNRLQIINSILFEDFGLNSISESNSESIYLLSGGDGYLKIWKLGASDQYTVWSNKNAIPQNTSLAKTHTNISAKTQLLSTASYNTQQESNESFPNYHTSLHDEEKNRFPSVVHPNPEIYTKQTPNEPMIFTDPNTLNPFLDTPNIHSTSDDLFQSYQDYEADLFNFSKYKPLMPHQI